MHWVYIAYMWSHCHVENKG